MENISIEKNRILLVEDNPVNIKIFSRILLNNGFILSVVESGAEAINMIEDVRPDLVLMDVIMPGIDGFETCRKIKANPKTEDIPILFVSALSDSMDKVEGLKSGAVDYITKPVKSEELIARVNIHLTIRNLQNKLKENNRVLKELQTQIIQNERLASIGHLAAGVAHELNNPIGFVMGNFNALKDYARAIVSYMQTSKGIISGEITEADYLKQVETLRREWEESNMDYIVDDISALISESEEGIERVVRIVKTLKDFSRVDTQFEENYDINKGVENTLVIARNEYKYVAEIVKETGEVPGIRANGGEINEVLLNIIVNAAQAIAANKSEPVKIISIKTYCDGNYVVCEIADNGPGIPDEIKDKIFDPFFTTKEPGKGTGLGLSIAYNIIVNKHKGKIELESKFGVGTKFTISLPVDNRG